MMKYRVLNIKGFTSAQFDSAFEKMSHERKARCLRFKLFDDRRRMVFAEELLRNLLAENFCAEESEIVIKNLPSGKPVAEVRGKEVSVSLSHSGDFVACAVSSAPVGIDLEIKREVKPSLLKALNEEELEFVNKSEDKDSAFLRIWTAKEAYLKLTGEGLAGLGKAHVLPLMEKGEQGGLKLSANHTEEYFFTIIYEM